MTKRSLRGFDAKPFGGLSHIDTSDLPREVVECDWRKTSCLESISLGSARASFIWRSPPMGADPEFCPEEFSENDRIALANAIRDEGKRVLGIVAEAEGKLPAQIHDESRPCLRSGPAPSARQLPRLAAPPG